MLKNWASRPLYCRHFNFFIASLSFFQLFEAAVHGLQCLSPYGKLVGSVLSLRKFRQFLGDLKCARIELVQIDRLIDKPGDKGLFGIEDF